MDPDLGELCHQRRYRQDSDALSSTLYRKHKNENLETSRLRLEPISDKHFDGLILVNSDPDVMQYITGRPSTPDDTRAMIDRAKLCWIKYGFSWWDLIEKQPSEIIGAGCVQNLERNEANPHEIGWRLRKEKWRQGFASEAAQRMAKFAFEDLKRQCCVPCASPQRGVRSSHEALGNALRG